MKGGESIFDVIQTLHMGKSMPGDREPLTPHEVNDLCNDLIERVSTWTPSAPGCEAYDALVRALAEQTLTDHGFLYHTPCDPPGPCVVCGHADADDSVPAGVRVADVSSIPTSFSGG